MANEKVVPIFPTANLKATLEFYTMLGFKVLYEQHAPYVYGSVALENIQIDFIGNKSLAPNQETGHTCLIVVSDVDALHQQFSSGIKNAYSKQLRSGIPRMNSVNNLVKDRRFNLLDPSGNRLIVVQVSKAEKPKTKSSSPLTKAMQGARVFAYSKDDPTLAAKHFDKALEKIDTESAVIKFQAFVFRADIAAMLDDTTTLEKYVKAAKNLVLEEIDDLTQEMQRLTELEEILNTDA